MNSLAHYTDADNSSRESSCVAYFARFCERAKAEMTVAEKVREKVRAEGHAYRPAPKLAPRPRMSNRTIGHGVSFDSVVKGMWVNQHALDVARRWSTIDHRTRRTTKGLLDQYASEAGVSKSVLKKLDYKIRVGEIK